MKLEETHNRIPAEYFVFQCLLTARLSSSISHADSTWTGSRTDLTLPKGSQGPRKFEESDAQVGTTPTCGWLFALWTGGLAWQCSVLGGLKGNQPPGRGSNLEGLRRFEKHPHGLKTKLNCSIEEADSLIIQRVGCFRIVCEPYG